ncbi:MAG: SIMPL domain-containing protein [Gammaproteobacteria bacterium]|nr:SIMPL domain-containing protein [Gammaproteobacteria bacterium]NNJ50366.1 SIMPL domain-containing protein [Gammaproteobacteria bacterium]
MIKIQAIFTAVFLLATIGINDAVAHEDETHYDRIQLSVSATAQLENDTMVATVSAQEEGSQAAQLSTLVNQRIRNALELVKKHPQIKHQTNAYSSNPIYNKNKITGWRVSQSLRLESSNMALMSDVLGKLQADLALQSMQFTVSPASKDKQDELLIDEALEAFSKRAQQVVNKLGRRNYKIVDINISTSGGRGIRPQYQMRAMAMDAESSPAISAGEQTVTVTVSGKIELE